MHDVTRQSRVFATTDPTARELAYKGTSVLPCRNRNDVEALRLVVAAFGGELTLLPRNLATTAEVSLATCCDVVLTWCPQLREEVALYAYLTGRRAVTVEDAERWTSTQNVQVVVVLADALSTRRLEELYEYGVVGVIIVRDQRSARQSILANAARHRLSVGEITDLPVYGVTNGESRELVNSIADCCVSDTATVDMVLPLGRGPSAVLSFIGHGDGVDAKLTSHTILCSKKVVRHEAPLCGSNCDATGYCHRRQRPRSEALQLDELISPNELTSRLFLMLACYSVLASDTAVSFQAGLISQLVSSPRVGAIIAAWEAPVSHASEAAILLHALRRGATVGDALSLLRASQGAVLAYNRYLLLGDPGLRVAGSQRLNITPLLKRPDPPLAELSCPFQHVPWFRLLLAKCKADENVLRDAREALETVDAQPTVVSHTKLLRLLLSHQQSLFLQWFDDAVAPPRYLDIDTVCFTCGERGRVFEIATTGGARWYASCSRCQTVYADVAAHSPHLNCSFSISRNGHVHHNIPVGPHQAYALNAMK